MDDLQALIKALGAVNAIDFGSDVKPAVDCLETLIEKATRKAIADATSDAGA